MGKNEVNLLHSVIQTHTWAAFHSPIDSKPQQKSEFACVCEMNSPKKPVTSDSSKSPYLSDVIMTAAQPGLSSRDTDTNFTHKGRPQLSVSKPALCLTELDCNFRVRGNISKTKMTKKLIFFLQIYFRKVHCVWTRPKLFVTTRDETLGNILPSAKIFLCSE